MTRGSSSMMYTVRSVCPWSTGFEQIEITFKLVIVEKRWLQGSSVSGNTNETKVSRDQLGAPSRITQYCLGLGSMLFALLRFPILLIGRASWLSLPWEYRYRYNIPIVGTAWYPLKARANHLSKSLVKRERKYTGTSKLYLCSSIW